MKVTELKHFINRTIVGVEKIKAEYGRTYNWYLCFTFSDGGKIILYGGVPINPKPDLEQMKKAPLFFSPEDIAAKVLEDEHARRRIARDRLDAKRELLESLKEELGES